ncbi:MAG: hypothetical protein KDC46_16355 [Thermoleophilia bacterium]|nr:hypothetical protein [Thermoleophilia bacterium]
MPLVRSFSIAVAIAALALAHSTAAYAGWNRVSEHSGANLDEVGMARDGAGVLHVAYRDREGTGPYTLRYRTLSANGRTWSTPTSIVGPWVGMTNPDLELVGGTLHAFWGGQGSTDVADPTSSGRAWYATLAGGTWTQSTSPMTYRATPYASTQVSSAVASDGTPWISWTITSQLAIHAGLAQGSEDETNLSVGCCEYASNIGRDAATGDLYVVWYSNVSGANGYYSRRIAPALGDVVRLASSAGTDATAGRNKRLAAASRTTGGVYSAYCDTYPTCSKLRVAGTSGPSLVRNLGSKPALAEASWVAAAPQGRMWLVWGDYDGRTWAVRSNKALTRWGALRSLGKPAASTTTWNVNADGTRGPLDVILNASAGSNIYQYHQRVLPGLSLSIVSRRRDSRGRLVVTLRANDAGDPVAARVRLLGTSLTARSNGLVRFTIASRVRSRTAIAVATRSGYAAGRVAVRLR